MAKGKPFKPANIAPRAHEIDAIVEVLESEEFDNAKQAARRIFSTTMALLAERDWYVVAQRNTGMPATLYGFFATESAAIKAIEQNSLGLLGGEVAIFPVKGLSARSQYLRDLEAELPRDCETCGHSQAAHESPRARGQGCVVIGCRCKTYVRDRRYELEWAEMY